MKWAGQKRLERMVGLWVNPYTNRLTRTRSSDSKIIAKIQREKFNNHVFDE